MRTTKKLMAAAFISAMMLSVASNSTITAHAATATPKITVSKKYVLVGKTKKLYIKNKVKGATYSFTSSNKKIVTVNKKTGVIKGVSVGNCQVKLTATVGKKTYTSTVKIIVKEHASSIRFSMDSDELILEEIGENVYTVSTLMATESGGQCTDRSFYIIPEETNTAGATIDTMGQISVEKPGSFQVIAVACDTAKTFQKGKYLAQSEPLQVTVPATLSSSMKSVNQIQLTTNSSLSSYEKSDFIVTDSQTGQTLKISDVAIKEDGKSAVITMANTFSKNAKYDVTLLDGSFTSSFVANYGSIAKIVANDAQTIAPSVATALDYTIYDENGIDITKLYSPSSAGFTFDFEPKSTTLDEYGRITLNNKNAYAFYTITYTYLDASNKPQKITSNTGRVTATASNLKAIKEYSISSNSNPDYTSPVHTLPVGETGQRLYCLFQNSVNGTIDTAKTNISNLTYTSNNTSICGIDRTTGLLYPYKEGNVTITISDGIFSDTVTLTIGEARQLNSLVADHSSITLSNTGTLSNSETVHFELRDQYGQPFKFASSTTTYPTIRLLSGSENLVTANGSYVTKTARTISTNASNGSFDLTFAGRGIGTCSIEVSCAGKTSIINLTVTTPGVVATYKPELSRTTLDPNVQGNNVALLKVYAVDANGIKINQITDGYYSIASVDGTIIVPNQLISNVNGETIDATRLKLSDGTYQLTVTSGPITESITFHVKASDALINLVPNTITSSTVSTTDDVATKIMDCFSFYLNGNSTAITPSTMITGSNPLVSNVKVSFTSYDSRYFDSGQDITIGSRDFKKNYVGYTASLRITKISFTYLGQTFTFNPDKDITLRVS